MNFGLWLDNLLAYSLQVATLAAVGTVLPLVLKLRHPGVLLHYWQGLFVACLVLPAIQPRRSLPVETLSLNDIGTVQFKPSPPPPPTHLSPLPVWVLKPGWGGFTG
jgi:hypothetical protein